MIATTWEDGTIETFPDTIAAISSPIWPYDVSGEAPRPLLDADLHMAVTRVRVQGAGSDFYNGSLDWDLHQSLADLPVLAERFGTFSWAYIPRKKGLYRMRATMSKTFDHYACQTPWRSFTVK